MHFFPSPWVDSVTSFTMVLSREPLGLLEYRFLAGPVGVLFFSDEFHRLREVNEKIGALGVVSVVEIT